MQSARPTTSRRYQLAVTLTTILFQMHDDKVIGFGISISSNGRWVMSCSAGGDLLVRDLSGKVAHRRQVRVKEPHSARVSPCGRYIFVCGAAAGIESVDVQYQDGRLQRAGDGPELPGHAAGVYDLAFGMDSSYVAIAYMDATWKLFNVTGEYLYLCRDSTGRN